MSRYMISILLSISLLTVLLGYVHVHGKVYLTKDEALKRAFPDVDSIQRKNVFLNDEEIKAIRKLSGLKKASKLFTYYIASKDGAVSGYAVIEKFTVRTKPAVCIIVIRPDGSLDYVKILAFYEPREYLPPERWLNQFKGRILSPGLWIKRDIQNISGATISAYGLIKEIRKVLSVFELKVIEVGK